MDEKAKAELIAQDEKLEAIKDFFESWWQVEQLYETATKATLAILYIIQSKGLNDEDSTALKELMEQHLMMIDLLKPFAENEEGV